MKCRDCKGKKTYLGAGMYAPETCRHCRGTGEEPVDEGNVGRELANRLLGQEAADAKQRMGDKFAQVREYAPLSARLREKCPKLQDAYEVTSGLTDHQEVAVVDLAQAIVDKNVEPLRRQIGALQQEVARLQEPRGMPEEHVISDIVELEPGTTDQIILQPKNANSSDPYALQRMMVTAVPVDLVDTNGENIELPVIIECGSTTVGHQPILLADVVSTAGMFEICGPVGPLPSQELVVTVKNPTTQKLLVTATAWIQKQPEPCRTQDPFLHRSMRMLYGR